jgi:uncharacterized membrane protein
MADLVAIGYDDETTASQVAEKGGRLADDLAIEPDAVAVIARDHDGNYNVTTNHHAVGAGATYGMFWNVLFGSLFFIPVLGMAIGAGLGALVEKVEEAGIDEEFQVRSRAMLKPGTSALFLVVEEVTPDVVVEVLGRSWGTALKSSLSTDGEQKLQVALHGAPVSDRDAMPAQRMPS